MCKCWSARASLTCVSPEILLSARAQWDLPFSVTPQTLHVDPSCCVYASSEVGYHLKAVVGGLYTLIMMPLFYFSLVYLLSFYFLFFQKQRKAVFFDQRMERCELLL